ncbi:MAG: hypothetical protein NT172_17605 [Planctomycetota bacterium]|nr:hypothetical protein [Planctomycetota bacterium]
MPPPYPATNNRGPTIHRKAANRYTHTNFESVKSNHPELANRKCRFFGLHDSLRIRGRPIDRQRSPGRIGKSFEQSIAGLSSYSTKG